MLYVHFTNSESNVESIIEDGIKLPFHLTTNLVKGTAYGNNMALFFVKEGEDFECDLGFVGQGDLVNKKAEGCIEYVIRTPKQLKSFLKVVERQGKSHAMNIKKYLQQVSEEERAIHLGKKAVNRIKRRFV